MRTRVALFTRAWIEMTYVFGAIFGYKVALFTRAWIEIVTSSDTTEIKSCRPLHEGVD